MPQQKYHGIAQPAGTATTSTVRHYISSTAQSKCQEYCKMSDLRTLAGQVHVYIYIKAADTSARELSS